MASPMVRVPEALKEVVQKLAEIHRQGDKRREVEAGLHRLLAQLIQPEESDLVEMTEAQISDREPAESAQDHTSTSQLGDHADDSTADNTTDSADADTAASRPDSKIDSKTASTSVVTSDIINVEEVVNRLAILEEKLAALEPQARTDSSTANTSDNTAANKADNRVDNSADATPG